MEYDLITELSKSSLFDSIKPSEIESFLNNNIFKINEYTKNDMFAFAGDQVTHLMVVIRGCLIARMVSESGKYIEIDRIGKGRVIAPAMLYATNNLFPVNIIPNTDTSIFFMHKNSFFEAMHKNEKLLYNFIRIVSDINCFLSTKIYTLSLKSIRARLAKYIVQESDRQDKLQITLPMSKLKLAGKFAVARQTLSRSFSELEKEKMILVKGRQIEILDKTKLLQVE